MAKPKKDRPADATSKKKRKKAKAEAVSADPVFTAEPVDAPDTEVATAGRLTPQRLLARMSGARLCYGKPVTGGDLTVVPVARVKIAGGFGGDDGGGGGGGRVDASPVGYIEVGPGGAHFRPIENSDRALEITRTVAVTAAAALGALAALRSLTR